MIVAKRGSKRSVKHHRDQKACDLSQAILNLPQDLRDVFLLHRMAGLTYDEIASRLGMNVQVVQSNLAAALAKLVAATQPAP